MTGDPKKIQALYDDLKGEYDIGTIDDFNTYLADPAKRQKFFDGVVKPRYDVASLGDFEKRYQLNGYGAPTQPQPALQGFFPNSNGAAKPSQTNGAPLKNFEQRINNPSLSIKNPDGTSSTHKMMSFEADGKYYAAPTIVEKEKGKLTELSADEAVDYALKTGEYREFKTDAEAKAYAGNGYKKGTPLEEKQNGAVHQTPFKRSEPTVLESYSKKLDTGAPKQVIDPNFIGQLGSGTNIGVIDKTKPLSEQPDAQLQHQKIQEKIFAARENQPDGSTSVESETSIRPEISLTENEQKFEKEYRLNQALHNQVLHPAHEEPRDPTKQPTWDENSINDEYKSNGNLDKIALVNYLNDMAHTNPDKYAMIATSPKYRAMFDKYGISYVKPDSKTTKFTDFAGNVHDVTKTSMDGANEKAPRKDEVEFSSQALLNDARTQQKAVESYQLPDNIRDFKEDLQGTTFLKQDVTKEKELEEKIKAFDNGDGTFAAVPAALQQEVVAYDKNRNEVMSTNKATYEAIKTKYNLTNEQITEAEKKFNIITDYNVKMFTADSKPVIDPQFRELKETTAENTRDAELRDSAVKMARAGYYDNDPLYKYSILLKNNYIDPLARGVATIGMNVGETPKAIADAFGDKAYGQTDVWFDMMGEFNRNLVQPNVGKVKTDDVRLFPEEGDTNWRVLPQQIMEQIPNLAMFMSAGKLMGAPGVFTTAFISQEGDAYREALDAWGAENSGKAAWFSIALTSVQSGMELMVMEDKLAADAMKGFRTSIIGDIGKFKTMSKKEIWKSMQDSFVGVAAKGFLEEGPFQEGSQAVADGMIKRFANQHFDTKYEDNLTVKSVWEQSFVGGVLGSAITSTGYLNRPTSPTEAAAITEVANKPPDPSDPPLPPEQAAFLKNWKEIHGSLEHLPESIRLQVTALTSEKRGLEEKQKALEAPNIVTTARIEAIDKQIQELTDLGTGAYKAKAAGTSTSPTRVMVEGKAANFFINEDGDYEFEYNDGRTIILSKGAEAEAKIAKMDIVAAPSEIKAEDIKRDPANQIQSATLEKGANVTHNDKPYTVERFSEKDGVVVSMTLDDGTDKKRTVKQGQNANDDALLRDVNKHRGVTVATETETPSVEGAADTNLEPTEQAAGNEVAKVQQSTEQETQESTTEPATPETVTAEAGAGTSSEVTPATPAPDLDNTGSQKVVDENLNKEPVIKVSPEKLKQAAPAKETGGEGEKAPTLGEGQIADQHAAIKRSGATQKQAEHILSFVGTVQEMAKMSKEKLVKALVRVPGVAEKSATKIADNIKNSAKRATLETKMQKEFDAKAKEANEISKAETVELNNEFEARQKELAINLTEDDIAEARFDELMGKDLLTDAEVVELNEIGFRPKGYSFNSEGGLTKDVKTKPSKSKVDKAQQNFTIQREQFADPISKETNSKPFTIRNEKVGDDVRIDIDGNVSEVGKRARFKTEKEAQKFIDKNKLADAPTKEQLVTAKREQLKEQTDTQLKRRMDTIVQALNSGSTNSTELDIEATAISDELVDRQMDKGKPTTDKEVVEPDKPLTRAQRARKLADDIDAATGGTAMILPKVYAGALRAYASVLEGVEETAATIKKAVKAAMDYLTSHADYAALSDEQKEAAQKELEAQVTDGEPSEGEAKTAENEAQDIESNLASGEPNALASVADAFVNRSDMDEKVKQRLLDNAALKLQTMSFEEMKTAGAEIVAGFGGVENAIAEIRKPGNTIPLELQSFVYGEAMKYAQQQRAFAKTEAEKNKWADYEAEVVDELTTKARSAGRFNAFIDQLYEESPYSVVRRTKKEIESRNKILAPKAKEDAKAVREILDDPTHTSEAMEQAVKEAVEQSNAERDKRIADLEKQLKELPKPPKAKTTKPRTYRITDTARNEAKKILFEVSANPYLDPRKWGALGTIAAYHIERGYYKFEDFYKKMQKELGGEYEDYYADLYNAAKQAAAENGIDEKEFDEDAFVEQQAQEFFQKEQRLKEEIAREKQAAKDAKQFKGKGLDVTIRQALIEAGYGKEINGKQQVDWQKVTASHKETAPIIAAISKALEGKIPQAQLDALLPTIQSRADEIIVEKKKTAVETKIKQINRYKAGRVLSSLKRRTRIENLMNVWKQGGLTEKVILDKLATDFGFTSFTKENEDWVQAKLEEIDKAPMGAEKELLEEELQAYLEDIGAPMIALKRVLEKNKSRLLSGPITFIKNLFGGADSMVMAPYKVMAQNLNVFKNGTDAEIAKVVAKAHAKALQTLLDIMLNGGVDTGIAISETTMTKEGSPRVRYMEHERKKMMQPIIRNILGIDVNVNPLNWEKYPQRAMAAVDAFSQIMNQEIESYAYIKNDLLKKDKNMSAKEASRKAYEIMYSVEIADATAQAVKEFSERGLDKVVERDTVADRARFNRRVNEIVEEARSQEAIKAGQLYGNRYTYKASDRGIMWPVIQVVLGLKNVGPQLAAKVRKKIGQDTPAGYRAQQAINGAWGVTFDMVLLPFVKSVGNIVEKSAEYLPAYGYSKAIAYAGIATYNKIAKADVLQADFERSGEYAYRATVGMLLMSALLAFFVDRDKDGKPKIYGEGSKDFNEREKYGKARPVNSVVVNGHVIPMDFFGPGALALRVKGAQLDAERYDKDKAISAGQLFAAVVGDLYLSQTQKVVQAFDQYLTKDKGEAGANLSGTISAELITRSLIPFTAALRQAEQIRDPQAKQAYTFGEKVIKYSGIIGGWALDRPAIDYRGKTYDTASLYPSSADGAIKMFSQTIKIDAVDELVMEYHPRMASSYKTEKDLAIPDADGAYRPMTTVEFYDFKKLKGDFLNGMLEEYAATNPKQKPYVKDWTDNQTDDLVKEVKTTLKNMGADPNNEMLINTYVGALKVTRAKEIAIKDRLGELNGLAEKAAYEQYLLNHKLPVLPSDAGYVKTVNAGKIEKEMKVKVESRLPSGIELWKAKYPNGTLDDANMNYIREQTRLEVEGLPNVLFGRDD